ncbi:hypothetical protein [Nocardioides sp. R-C-SC26]|uniref:hypothetical protein n=1 Tax=Nocardioides sp. R-C-SC26 TaxID=2870414 RepID=UPI001E500739|nr:hypothetical protein [Nocardioides sp. R-C-SC26]
MSHVGSQHSPQPSGPTTPRPAVSGRTARRIAAALAAGAVALGLSACGGDGGSTTVKKIDITFSGSSVTPNGDRVKVDVDQPIDLIVTADEPGELHVHSEPEQSFEYEGGGATTTIELQIARPGVVEVESHDLDELVVSLEVS